MQGRFRMMSKCSLYRALFLAAVASFFVSSTHMCLATPPTTDEVIATIEKIRSLKDNPGMAVAVFSGRDILHLSLHGFADAETKRKISKDSLFMIGSTTKAMTATAAGYLIQDHKLSWDTKVKTLVPEFKLRDAVATEEATLRDLLLHRTGLARHDFAWLTRPWSAEQFLTLAGQLEMSLPFRAKFQYQNLMYMVAGMMIAEAAKDSWAQVVEDKIFKNLGMQSTRAVASKLSPSDDIALPYEWDETKLVKIPARNIDAVGPAGSVHSSITDMIKWVQFNMNQGAVDRGVSLAKNIMAEIHHPQMEVRRGISPFPELGDKGDYAFGWGVTSYRGHVFQGHGGGIDGYTSDVTYLPERDLGLVILSNAGDLELTDLNLTLLDLFLEAERVDWPQRLASPEPPVVEHSYPESYALTQGSFSHPVYGQLKISPQTVSGQKKLYLDLNGGYTFKTKPWLTTDPKVWRWEEGGEFLFHFHFDDAGKLTSIEANLESSVKPLLFLPDVK